jgi:peptide/nickel transport system substrate-binding protein
MLSRNMILAIVVIVILAVGVGAAVVLLRPAAAPSITLWYNSTGHYGDTEPAVAQLIKAQIEATGKVTVNLQSEDWASYRADFAKGNLPFFMLGWYPDYFDTDDYVSPFYSTAGAQSEGSFYTNATMDKWVTNETASVNPTVRGTYFQQIQNQSAKDVPYIPLWMTNAHVVYDSDITGVFLHPVVFKYFIMNKPGFDHITVGTTDSPTSFDPALAYDYFSGEIINQVFDTLLVYQPTNGSLLPGLATQVPTVGNGGISPDGMTYTFQLRPGLKFTDGSSLNSTTVKRAIQRVIRMNLAGSAEFLLEQVAQLGKTPTIDTPNCSPGPCTTIVFHLLKPVGLFNQIMAFSVAAPVPWWYNQTGAQQDIVSGNVKVTGEGPYSLTSITPNQQYVLQKNTGYYNPGLYSAFGIPTIPILSKIIINRYSDSSSLKLAIQTHQINMAYRTLNPTDLTALQGSAASLNLKVDIGTSPQIRFLVFNVNKAPFNDVRVRQAIAYAVDRSSIVSNVFHGFAVTLYSMVPPGFFGPDYSSPVFQTVYGTSPNIAKATSLFSAASLAISFGIFQADVLERNWL